MAANNFDKFCLLLWKNWLLQWRHKIQTIIEIIVPVVFCSVLVVIRCLVDPEVYPDAMTYKPSSIDTLEPLQTILTNNYLPQPKWQLIYTPKSKVFDELMQTVSSQLKLKHRPIGVNNSEHLQDLLITEHYLSGIVFHHKESLTVLPGKLHYSLRFPAESRSAVTFLDTHLYNWFTNLLFPPFLTPGPRNHDVNDGGIPPGYRQEGFLAVQNAIAVAFLKSFSIRKIPNVLLQRFPYPPHVYDIYLARLETLVSLLVMLSFVYPCINTTKFIAIEKERQIKEAMKIMGLSNWLHWTGWFVRTMILFTITISLMVLVLKANWYTNVHVSILTSSDWTILWFFLFLYGIATTTYCFMLSVFFSKANTAAAMAGLAWFIFYSVYMFNSENYEDLTFESKLLISIFSNTAMALGFQLIVRFEGTGEGLQWNNLWRPVSIDDNLSVGILMIMLMIGAILYFLIALYVEQIYPGDYGVAKPWYFPLQMCCRSKMPANYSTADESFQILTNENCEVDPIGKRAGIRVKNLRKIYRNGKVAVNGLSLNMFNDQITVLLGHNGAGKTTTMSMLCGMISPTSGTAIVNGYDIRNSIEGVRNSLGLCPQHNILFDDLTVREHIEFYCRLKGVSRKDAIEAEVEKYVRLIKFESKINAMACTLSGGMKRKLSVCVAFCGGSKVVLCDEPTSGMDPSARRSLWEVLKAEKAGRTILLSTHFMDEADILGDRIAIMANGHMKCSGSAYFLKKKFGVGYHLICVKQDRCDTTKVTDLLKKFIPNVSIETDVGTELTYLLTNESSHLFKQMFEELEKKMKGLRIDSYGVSLTTLEEVFMKVGSDSIAKSLICCTNNSTTEVESDPPNRYAEEVRLVVGFQRVWNQVVAMFWKKYLQTVRNWILVVLQITIPLTFLIITLLALRKGELTSNLPKLPIKLSAYRNSITVLERGPFDKGELSEIAEGYQKLFSKQTGAKLEITSDRMTSYILDKCETKPIYFVNSRYIVGATIKNRQSIIAWFNNQPFHGATLSVNLVHNAIIEAFLGPAYGISLVNEPLPFAKKSQFEMLHKGGSFGFKLAISVAFSMAFMAAFYLLPYVKERECRSKLLQFVSGVNVLTFWLTAFIWDFVIYLLTITCLIVTLIIFQEDGWSSSSELCNVLQILVSFGFATIPITYICTMFFSAPATAFTRMTMVYVLTGIGFFITVFTLSLEVYNLEDIADGMTWVFMVFPHFALCHSLNNLNQITVLTRLCANTVEFCPGCTDEQICEWFPECCSLEVFSWDEPGIQRNMVFMWAIGGSSFLLLLFIEYNFISGIIYRIKGCFDNNKATLSNNQKTTMIDSDVADERTYVAELKKPDLESYNLVVKNISKWYGKFLAVNQISFKVDHSECFGLLGSNGAGKTSTFKMLTGDLKITLGEAWLRGISLNSRMNQVNQMIGYCPQFDALIEEMTGRETLEIYCLLRGIPNKKIAKTCKTLANDLNFLQHIDKRVKEYSGGNKRKLSTAIALISNPTVVYLDEPTSGQDPASKRHLWNMICKIRNAGISIVLTSHSMDECEALCTRLAVMVNGEFKCIGSVQHLKNKFAKGYTLVVKLRKIVKTRKKVGQKKLPKTAVIQLSEGTQTKVTLAARFSRMFRFKSKPKTTANKRNDKKHGISPSPPPLIGSNKISKKRIIIGKRTQFAQRILEFKQFISCNFPGTVLQQEYQGLLTYYIPHTEEIKWSTMFGIMEQAKQQFNIEDYSLSQTTLEQVFLSFMKHQLNENPLKVANQKLSICAKLRQIFCWYLPKHEELSDEESVSSVPSIEY